MAIKLIAIDMDGTLLLPDHTISPAVKAAIAAARERGVNVVLTTGRPYAGVHSYLKELHMEQPGDYCITYNGALVQKAGDGSTVAQTALSYDDYRFLEQLSREVGSHFHALDRNTLYTANRDISYYTVHESYVATIPLVFCEAEKMDPEIQLLKVMMIDEPAILDQAIARIPAEVKEKYTVLKSAPYFLEILDKRVNKGTGVKSLADALGIKPEEIMAIGDQENDIAMIEFAGVGAEPADVPAPVDTETETAESAPILPFLGDEARKRGYVLPLPFGVSINYMDMRQNINVDSISFTGLSLDGRNIDCGKDPVCKHAVKNIFAKGPVSLDNAFQIGVGHTRESSKTETLKLDAWLLPFMNVYGLVGHTEGHSISQIAVGLKGPNGKVVPMPGMQDLDFRLDFKGTTYGMGTTLVGGVGNWFTVLDANYTQTRFDILDGSIDAITISPRVGYRFNTPSVDALHLPAGKLNLWVGSMYQDVQQEFKGSLNDLSMPSPLLQNMVNLANQDNNGRFDVKQHLQSPWNVLVGAQYELTQNFNITTEFGFAERNSFFISGEYRF